MSLFPGTKKLVLYKVRLVDREVDEAQNKSRLNVSNRSRSIAEVQIREKSRMRTLVTLSYCLVVLKGRKKT